MTDSERLEIIEKKIDFFLGLFKTLMGVAVTYASHKVSDNEYTILLDYKSQLDKAISKLIDD